MRITQSGWMRCWAVAAVGCACLASSPSARCEGAPGWPQWGGPSRDFKIDAPPLSTTWGEAGPKELWKRELGDGYSSIAAQGDRLFTMYRSGETEFSVALDAKTGKTLWKVEQASPFTQVMAQYGAGPHSTPLLADGMVFTIGANGVLHALKQDSGEVVWKHDLAKDFGVEIRARGYSCNPITFEDLLIVPGGSFEKKGHGVLAFDRDSGSLRWKSGDFGPNYGSPLLIRFDGAPQLVNLTAEKIAGLHPRTGEVLWEFEHKNSSAVNASMPVWDGKDTIFVSSAYDSGSRALRLEKRDGKIVPRELWFGRKIRIHFGNAVRLDRHVYCSTGMGSAFFGCVDIYNGRVAWRKRGFARANVVAADGKLIVLDEDGNLAIATATPSEMTVHAQAQVAGSEAWAAPTLVGNTLFVRDRKHIMALDLGG